MGKHGSLALLDVVMASGPSWLSSGRQRREAPPSQMMRGIFLRFHPWRPPAWCLPAGSNMIIKAQPSRQCTHSKLIGTTGASGKGGRPRDTGGPCKWPCFRGRSSSCLVESDGLGDAVTCRSSDGWGLQEMRWEKGRVACQRARICHGSLSWPPGTTTMRPPVRRAGRHVTLVGSCYGIGRSHGESLRRTILGDVDGEA